MQNWQKDRNYRKYTDESGAARYVVTIDGEDIEVGKDVYEAYSQGDRRERYQAERDAGRLLSLERMNEDGAPAYPTGRYAESTEDAALRSMLTEQALAALEALEPEERELIRATVMDGVTEREYAARIKLSQKGVNKRKKKAIANLRKILVLKPGEYREGQ